MLTPDRRRPVIRGLRLWTAALALALAATATLAACGGSDDEAGEQTFTFDTGIETTETASEPTSVDPAALPGPGEARVEVDGEVYVLRASGSVNFVCEATAEAIRVNFQETDSGSLFILGGRLDGGWNGNVTFSPTGQGSYGGNVDDTAIAVGENGVTYTGTLTYRSFSDPTETREVDGSIAANCASGGGGTGGAGEATAELDGTTLTFPASGAQSYDCEITPTSVSVVVNRLAREEKQIQIDATQTAGEWLGNVYVISGTDRYNGLIPADGTGLEITGNTLTFMGSFTQTSESDPNVEREVSGSASVTCP